MNKDTVNLLAVLFLVIVGMLLLQWAMRNDYIKLPNTVGVGTNAPEFREEVK